MQNKQKHYLVYKTTCLINGKIYIGQHQTYDLNDGYLGSGTLLGRAIKKYGEENFKREILFECSSKEEMNAKEAELVNEDFLKRDDVYNLQVGGGGGFDYINRNRLWGDPSKGGEAFAKKLKEDHKFREQISNGIKQVWKEHPEIYASSGNSHKSFLGKHHTEETKQKMREAAKNRDPTKNGFYNTVWVSNEELRVSFNIPKSMLFDYIGMGYFRKRINNWDLYFNNKLLKQNGISLSHLTNHEQQMLSQNKAEDIIRERNSKKQKKRLAKQERIKQVQEIANYYMEYGFEKTQQKYKAISPGLTSLESMLGMFSHYKQRYGINFIARNNTPGVVNGSYFKK